jgi:hypothetical protein
MSTAQDHLDDIASSLELYTHSKGKATMMFKASNEGRLIYVSPREKDVLFGLMSCVIDIMIARGKLQGDERVKIRRIGDLVAPGHNVYWSVHDANGTVVAGGYVASEDEATKAVANFMLSGQAPNQG